jgi:hypothetical protein
MQVCKPKKCTPITCFGYPTFDCNLLPFLKLSVHSSNFKHIDFHWTHLTYHLKEVSRALYQQPSCTIDLWNCIVTTRLSQWQQHRIYIYIGRCALMCGLIICCVYTISCVLDGWMIVNNSTNLRFHKPLFDHSYHIHGWCNDKPFHHLPWASVLFC